MIRRALLVALLLSPVAALAADEKPFTLTPDQAALVADVANQRQQAAAAEYKKWGDVLESLRAQFQAQAPKPPEPKK